jgi:hypothetical protein
MKFPNARMTTTMEIKRTEDGWELSCPIVCRDFHIRYEFKLRTDNHWVLDEFDTEIEDNNEAHIESTDHKDITDALHAAFEVCEEILDAHRQPRSRAELLTLIGELADELSSRLEHVPAEHQTEGELEVLQTAREVIKAENQK